VIGEIAHYFRRRSKKDRFSGHSGLQSGEWPGSIGGCLPLSQEMVYEVA